MEEKPSGYSAGNRLELIASMRRERERMTQGKRIAN
jgi:hypothetical protein